MKNFFISYTGSDKNWAEWIAWQLEEAGYTTIIQAWHFRPGSNFVLEMQKAATDCERTIAVLSTAYMKSGFTQPEWAAAFAKDPKGEKGTLLPVRVEDFDPEGLLGPIVYIDLVGKAADAAKETLLAGVERGDMKPTTAPLFPGGVGPAKTPPAFPGALPGIWNVPHRRNPNFTGREDLLESLGRGLASGKVAALTQALAGLGGVGKTQTALEYAYRHAAEYQAVWWIRSEESATLAADFASLARKLNLPEKDAQEQEVIVEAVRAWLDAHSGWLLIFDNAVAPEDIRPYLPKNASGHVIITSRNPVFGEDAAVLPVHEWKRPESVAFLAKRTKRNDSDGADAVADKLGDLPLALAQAAAYMEATGASYAGYLELFSKQHGALWKNEPPPKDYPATVATTWKLSMEEAEETAPGAAELMNLCAFLAPDDIPRDMLRDGSKHVPEPLCCVLGDDLRMNTLVAALRRFSLLEVRADAFDMHRLVQAVVQDRLDAEARKIWCVAAARVVEDAYPEVSSDVRSWPVCACLTPHARKVAAYAEKMDVAQNQTVHLLNQMGTYLRSCAEFGDARTCYERALAIVEAVCGPNHPSALIAVNNLGRVLQDLGDLVGARKQCARALAIAEATYEPNHPYMAASFNSMGLVLKDLGDSEGARVYLERALAVLEERYGPEHPTVATLINNLGFVLNDLGNLVGARAHYERALVIVEAVYGPNHPKVANDLNNLGMVLKDLGDLGQARAHFERALAINEEAYGPNHPAVAAIVNNLGLVLQSLGDLAQARAFYERALRINEDVYGPNHPAVAMNVNNMGSVVKELGDLVGARVYHERALAIAEAIYGPSHPNVAICIGNMGEVLEALGEMVGARTNYERALVMMEATYGPKHPKVAVAAGHLGDVLRMLGDLAGAREYLKRVLAIDEAVYGPNHPEVARNANNLGSVLQDLGDLAGARACFERSLTIARTSLGESHPNTLLVAKHLAALEK